MLITLPAVTVLLAAVVKAPIVSPAPVIAVVAAACVCPTTFGTDTWAAATLMVIVLLVEGVFPESPL